MGEGITFVGLDAHKASISVAMLLPDAVIPIEWQLPNEAGAVRHMVRRIEKQLVKCAPATKRGRAGTRCSGGSPSQVTRAAWWWRRR